MGGFFVLELAQILYTMPAAYCPACLTMQTTSFS